MGPGLGVARGVRGQMESGTDRYDVALSFAGPDRPVAQSIARELKQRGMTVFFDETARATTWGKDLPEHLHDVYSAKARYCVPLLSEHYLHSQWTKLELQAALERRLADKEYLLPVRLDATPVPELPSTIVFLDLAETGPAAIADAVQEKFLTAPVAMPDVADAATSTGAVRPPDRVPGFVHTFYNGILEVRDPSLIERCAKLTEDADPMTRIRLGRDLKREVSFKHDVDGGATYTAWRMGDSIYVSLLPTVADWKQLGQKTLEFDVRPSQTTLVGKWTSSAGPWGPIGLEEFKRHLEGLMADRSGCEIRREATLLILKARGARFQFPVAPTQGEAETWCGWRRERPRPTAYDWDRNPLAEYGSIGVWQLAYHSPTQEGLLIFTFAGDWTNAAIQEFRDALQVLLPGRHHLRVTELCHMRVCVHLCNAPVSSPYRSAKELDFCLHHL
jgi:hypothetical protein